MPCITIIVPAYNNANLLPRCLKSISSQVYGKWNAIVVNDASTDDTSHVAHNAARQDSRISVIDKPKNEGLHLARKTGVEAADGDYVMFLDADDELADCHTLEALANETLVKSADIIRFGLIALAEEGTPEDTALAFTEWSNTELSEQKTMQEMMEWTYSPIRHWALPWHVTHRLFKSDLAKRAFDAMTGTRLERAEDAYEYFVLASMANDERSCCAIKGYLYHMGTGVTNVKSLSADQFARETKAIWKNIEASEEFASSIGSEHTLRCARGLKAKLLESIGNSLNERVDAEERPEAESNFVDIVGEGPAAVELWRFVRDRAWRLLVEDRIPAENDDLFKLEMSARSIVPSNGSHSFEHNKNLAEKYLAMIRQRMRLKRDKPRAQIFVSAHLPVDAFDSDTLRLMQVGASCSSERFWNTLHDDDGESISHLNPYYCELTAQYWAWKNVDADFYGFCHYRRYFNFSDNRYDENAWGEVIDEYITEETQRKYGLDDETIGNVLEQYDVLTTEFKDFSRFPDGASTSLGQWHKAPSLKDEDFETMLAILLNRHPDYEEDVSFFCNASVSCFCNMYIMRKDIFFDYCSWLFPLLEEFMRIADFSTCSRETARTPGHLAERLFNIYFIHQNRLGTNWRHRELQCVHFLHPSSAAPLKPPSEWQANFKQVVPIALAADNAYVPMLTTTIHSLLENASEDFYYDIIVMTTDISPENQATMQRFLNVPGKAAVRFLFVWHLIKDHNLMTNNPHIGIETYYRFFIQDALPDYDKVLYLDSDLIVQGDVAELYSTDLGSNLIGAVIDVDYLGNLNKKGTGRREYSESVLGMANPYDYFQAGVLVMNTAALRREIPVQTWLEEAQDSRYIYNDQDILNRFCEGRVTFLDPSWNVMHNGFDRIGGFCCHAPASVFAAYLDARKHEKIIHYAGAEKPWNDLNCDRAFQYWKYARETPFYEQLVTLLAYHAESRYEEMKREKEDYQIVDDNNPIRSIVDPVLPPGSQRREVVRTLAKKFVPKP